MSDTRDILPGNMVEICQKVNRKKLSKLDYDIEEEPMPYGSIYALESGKRFGKSAAVGQVVATVAVLNRQPAFPIEQMARLVNEFGICPVEQPVPLRLCLPAAIIVSPGFNCSGATPEENQYV